MTRKEKTARISIGVLCLGLFVFALFTLPGSAMIFLLIFLIAAYFDYKHKSKNQVEGQNKELNVQGLVEKYGDPDDTIIANPTRGNDVEGCILVYKEKGFLIINGLEVKKSEITDYVLKNDGANPYLPADYQLHLTTTLDDYPMLCVPLGNEISWAEEVLREFQQEIQSL